MFSLFFIYSLYFHLAFTKSPTQNYIGLVSAKADFTIYYTDEAPVKKRKIFWNEIFFGKDALFLFLNYTNIFCLTLFDMYIQNYVLL